MIGIDLGTTNSLVAAMRNGDASVLANELDEQLTPSVVAVAEDGEGYFSPITDRNTTVPTSRVDLFYGFFGSVTASIPENRLLRSTGPVSPRI